MATNERLIQCTLLIYSYFSVCQEAGVFAVFVCFFQFSHIFFDCFVENFFSFFCSFYFDLLFFLFSKFFLFIEKNFRRFLFFLFSV